LLRVNLVDEPFVFEFCRVYHTRLLRVDTTTENGAEEPVYIFSDNLGGYTIEGVKESLENLENN
jgi:hypothetical protein